MPPMTGYGFFAVIAPNQIQSQGPVLRQHVVDLENTDAAPVHRVGLGDESAAVRRPFEVRRERVELEDRVRHATEFPDDVAPQLTGRHHVGPVAVRRAVAEVHGAEVQMGHVAFAEAVADRHHVLRTLGLARLPPIDGILPFLDEMLQ